MRITDTLSRSATADENGRRRATRHLTDRLEPAAETVRDLSRRTRTAGERVADVADRGIDGLEGRSVAETVDAIREAVGDSNRTALRERLVDECCGRVLGESLADVRDPFDPEARPRDGDSEPDPSLDSRDRAFERFLRRYGLTKARLDEETLAALRSRLTDDVDPNRLLEALRDESTGSLEDAPATGAGDDLAADLADLASQFRADLDLEDERSLADLLAAIAERDAVVAGHAVEDALEEGREIVERRAAATTGPEPPGGAALGLGTEGTAGDPGSDGSLPDVREALPVLVSALIDGGAASAADDGPPLERALLAVLSSGPLETDGGGFDLASLGPESTERGSLALVGLFVANLVAMTLGAWASRRKAPPIPDEIRGPDGGRIVTAEQVRLGKKAFQANGLMNHGSILGNGSYFGVDLTADALDLKVEFMREYYARQRGADSFDALEEDDRVVVAERVERELDADAPETAGSVVEYSPAEAYAHRRIRERYVDRYHGGAPERGVPQGFVDSPAQAARIADFACWTAWMAHTDRPDAAHSYTNDWPYVPEAGNRPTGQVLVWSAISVVLLVAGGGAGVWAYHAYDFAEPTTDLVDVPAPDSVSITPTQYAAAWYVPVAGALFVAQALVGALLAHYYVERTGFYGLGDALGIDVVSLLPFSIGRTWHVNLAVLWITTLWLAGGLFLPGLFADRDPPWQAEGATVLLGALVVATVGAFAGVWLGIQGKLGSPEDGDLWWWLGSEGLEYLETGRVWKLSLLAALAGWTGLVLRSVRRLEEPPTGLGHFMTYAGGSIALLFGASMLYTPETNIAVTEFWRWWVVHMWVEGVFEFFVTAVVSVALVSMDLLDRADAERAILFEVFAIMAAGIVGVSHHYWWVGLPDIWVPIGTTFSTLEFVPLIFVLYRSVGEYRTLSAQGEEFPYKLPLLFIVGSSVWNFVGGGVLGFFINLPVINYYEHGTYLTVAHGHAATFGAFGLLALGLGTYILRVVTPEESWEPAWFRGAFWLTNVGLAVMTFASLLPLGFVQLRTAYQEGYAAARSLEFYERDRVQTLLWARTLGDTPMILGALAFTAGAIRNLAAARRRSRTIEAG